MSQGSTNLFNRRTLPWVLLVFSLLLNLYLVGDKLYEVAEPTVAERPGMDTESIVSHLNLTPEQEAAFRALRARLSERRETFIAERSAHSERLWQEMAKTAPDRAAVDAEIDRLAQNRAAFMKEAFDSTLEFMNGAGLSADQRQRMAEIGKQGLRRGKARSAGPDADTDS